MIEVCNVQFVHLQVLSCDDGADLGKSWLNRGISLDKNPACCETPCPLLEGA